MSDRDTVLELVKQLPPDISLQEIIRRIELLQSQLSQSETEYSLRGTVIQYINPTEPVDENEWEVIQ
ncbi:MAG: hypothetical protein WBA13_03505 [Microcoleaceae cyanobacterium]